MSSINPELARKSASSQYLSAEVFSKTSKKLTLNNLYENLSDDDEAVDLKEKVSRQGAQNLTPSTETAANTASSSLPSHSFHRVKKSVKKISHEWTEIVSKADVSLRFIRPGSNISQDSIMDFPIPWKQVKKGDKQAREGSPPNDYDWNSKTITSIPRTPYIQAQYDKHKHVIAARHKALGTKPLKIRTATTTEIERNYNLFLKGCLRELTVMYGEETLIQNGLFELYQSWEIPEAVANRPLKNKAAKKHISKLSQKCDQLSSIAKMEFNQFHKELATNKREVAAIKAEAALTALIEHIQKSYDADHTKISPELLYALFEKLNEELMEAYFKLACIYYEKLLYQKALKCLNDLINENPLHLKAVFLRGRIHFDLGKLVNAKDDFEFVINQDHQQSFLVRSYLMATKIRLHYFEQSTTTQFIQSTIKSYLKILTCPEMSAFFHSKAALFLADLYFLKGNYSLAALILKKACSLDRRAYLNPYGN